MRFSSLQTLVGGFRGVFARPKEMHARVRIDPGSHLTQVDGAEISEPPLAIAVRLANARTEVVSSREAIHE